MKILLLYYTGTYSTLYITTLIKNQLINKGYEVDVLSVFEKAKVNPAKIPMLIAEYKGALTVKADAQPCFIYHKIKRNKKEKDEDVLEVVKKVLISLRGLLE